MAAPSLNTDFTYSLQTMEANLSELEVMKFLIEKGGRCTNYELVSNFRAVLNNPLYQAEARVKFKDIINTVATVGEYENVKYIELKQEYRDNNCNQQENFSSVSSSLSSEGSSYTSPLTQNFQPYWRYRLSTSTRVPTLPSRSPEYENVLLQSSRETCPSPAPIQFNRSVSESTLSHPVKNHPHHEDGSSPTRRQRGLSASSFNRSFLENHYRNQTPHLEENQPIRRVSVSDLDTSNRIAYNKSQANYSPERPHNLYGRHFNGILKNPPPSNHEFNRTVSESIPLRPPETYFEGDIGLPQHPMFRRPSHHSATDLNRSELAQPAIADDCSVRTTKRSGICNDEILLKLQEDNYSKTSSTPISMCINRMHGIPAKDSFHDIPVSVFSETPVSTSISRSDAKGSFHSTSVPECTETSVSASINRMHGIHAKNSFNGISRSEYSEMPVSTSVNRSDAQDTFRHTPVSEYSDTSVSASINRMHGIHERDSFHDDTFSKQPDGSFPLENSNLNNASECTDFRKREQIEKFGTTSRNTISASIPKTAYQYHNSTGNNLKETVADDLSSTSCVPQKNFQCDNYQKEEISLRTPFSGLDVYSNHSDSLNLGNETAASNQRVLGNLENSIQNCVEQHEKPPPLPPERRRKSQDRSRVDVDVSDNNSTEQMLEKGIVTVTGKVKDRVQHFDDMEKKRNTKRCLSPLPDKENRMTKSAGMEDDISISALDPKLKREWFVKAAQGDYHALVGLLKKEPKLAAIKDIGSTALHWAAKHGDANIVKLIAGAYKVNTNIRSGYTPVHVATLYKHDVIVHLLIHTYGADPSIRDYNGKRADQYPEDYIRVVAGLKTVERKPLKQRTLEKEPSLSFMRIGSLNLRKSRKSTVFASVRGSARNFGSTSEMKFGNRVSTRKKSHKNVVFEKKNEPESKNDSDSDSAYGFYSK